VASPIAGRRGAGRDAVNTNTMQPPGTPRHDAAPVARVAADGAAWDRRAAGAWLRALNPLHRLWARLLLSRAKHRSLAGHPRIARRLSRLIPYYHYTEAELPTLDGAPLAVQARRRVGWALLGAELRAKAPQTLEASAELQRSVSDAALVDHYRVPFQFRQLVRESLPVGTVVQDSAGPRLRDLDGNWSYDLGGSYGVNLFGTEFYKRCMARAVATAGDLGLVLGPLHPLVAENARRIREISGLDEVSFHMSGTEAVMQAVRLARYHTRRSHVVRFAGAYHGWWDGVQPGVGNPRPPHELHTLAEMSELTLRVLRTRDDIACVLVNPIQAMHPNAAPPSDSTLASGVRRLHYDRAAYTAWLRALREVCTERRIVLIFDEVFLGFRLARGGVQEYFGVRADLVTYGKSLGGGLPVGVLAGRASLMRRFRDDRPGDLCLARGTFNAHPYVMAAMHEFLQHVDTPEVRAHYATLDACWDTRAARLNLRLAEAGVPIRVAHLTSIWSLEFLEPGCYNWLLQYYLRAAGLAMSWIGTGRFIFSHDLTDADFEEIGNRIVSAALRMHGDGWWTPGPASTAREITRRMLRETWRARRPRATSDRSTLP